MTLFNLPDWKGALNEALNNYVKSPLESKSSEFQKDFNKKFTEFQNHNNRFQQNLIVIAFASFLVLTITLTFQDKNEPINQARKN